MISGGINATMKTMVVHRPGFPIPTMIPQGHYIGILDLKDCIFLFLYTLIIRNTLHFLFLL